MSHAIPSASRVSVSITWATARWRGARQEHAPVGELHGDVGGAGVPARRERDEPVAVAARDEHVRARPLRAALDVQLGPDGTANGPTV